MGDNSAIEWTDASWNVVTGCSVVSPGCTNCYAMRQAGTRLKSMDAYRGLTLPTRGGPVWNGKVRFNDGVLFQPLRWRRPRRIFVNSMGDLFHEDVPDEWIDQAFAVMALAPRHSFQVLTKRAERMHAYLTYRAGDGARERVESRMARWADDGSTPLSRDDRWTIHGRSSAWTALTSQWPLPNVWLGVSVEDQERAEHRIPKLLATPAAVRWVSAEPLLGALDLDRLHSSTVYPGGGEEHRWDSCLSGRRFSPWADCDVPFPRIDWVVAGGESGPGARPMYPVWPRVLRDQCVDAGVAFHFKQWGEWLSAGDDEDGDLPPRRVGKKAAGRVLDGRTWDEFPGGAS